MVELDTTELAKGGGGVRCTALTLDNPPRGGRGDPGSVARLPGTGRHDWRRRAVCRPPPAERREPPVALVYRGPASLPGCPEAVAALLQVQPVGLRRPLRRPRRGPAAVRRGPWPARRCTRSPAAAPSRTATATCAATAPRSEQFVRSGGQVPRDSASAATSPAPPPASPCCPGTPTSTSPPPAATVASEDDTLVEVSWRGRRADPVLPGRPVLLAAPGAEATVVATYPNGTIAALVAGFGAGRVGVVGPHPEATEDWYTDAGLRVADRLGADLGLDLVEAVMRP